MPDDIKIYEDRYTSCFELDTKEDRCYIYYSNENISDIYRRLGFYEDIGYSALEILEIVIKHRKSIGESTKKYEILKERIEKFDTPRKQPLAKSIFGRP